jgi:hypothetical protein
MLVVRDGNRVRLLSAMVRLDRGIPLIVKAALRNRSSSFVIDGEAVLLGVDGPPSTASGRSSMITRYSSTRSTS